MKYCSSHNRGVAIYSLSLQVKVLFFLGDVYIETYLRYTYFVDESARRDATGIEQETKREKIRDNWFFV